LVYFRVIVLNNITDLKKIIAESSQNNKMDILISLRAFLADQEDYPWVYFKNIEEIPDVFSYLHSKNILHFKNINTINLRKAKISPVQIYIMPKNKRLILIDLIDDELSDFISDHIFLVDKIRANPFENDLVYEFLIKNKNLVDKSLFAVYEERNKSHKKLLNLTEIKKSIYDTCSSMSKKNKLKDYWINLWGDSKNYSESSIIENIVI
jgi:hypothetical protein